MRRGAILPGSGAWVNLPEFYINGWEAQMMESLWDDSNALSLYQSTEVSSLRLAMTLERRGPHV